ncbi:MAG: O-antigen ligase family protein [Gemmataceae bacterium]
MIWLLGFYMWLYVHRPFEVWPALGAMQIERGTMFLMALVWLVSPEKKLIGNAIHAAVAAFTVVLVAAWVVSPYADRPGCWEVLDTYFKVLVFYCMVVTTVRDERTFRLLILMFLGAVALYMAHSLFEFVNGRYQYRMGIRRMTGVDTTFGDPNAFASGLLYTLPLILPFWYEQPRRVPRWLLLGYVGGVLLCIMLTGSRAGFMGVCVLGLLMLLAHSRSKLQTLMVGAVVGSVFFLVLSAALPEELQNRYLTLVDSSRGPANAKESADGRMDGFMWGLYVWQQSPLLGHGPASFAYSTGRGGQAHNLYGQVLSEMGVVGAVALLGLVVCFWRNWRTAGRLQREHAIPTNDFAYQVSRALGFNVVMLLVMGWSGHNLFRYYWQWFAAFSVISVHCLGIQAAAQAQAYMAYHYHQQVADDYPTDRLGFEG